MVVECNGMLVLVRCALIGTPVIRGYVGCSLQDYADTSIESKKQMKYSVLLQLC